MKNRKIKKTSRHHCDSRNCDSWKNIQNFPINKIWTHNYIPELYFYSSEFTITSQGTQNHYIGICIKNSASDTEEKHEESEDKAVVWWGQSTHYLGFW